MKGRLIILILMVIGCLTAAAQPVREKQTDSYRELYIRRGDTVAFVLHHLQKPIHYRWRRSGWWNDANIFEALLDHQRLAQKTDTVGCRRIFIHNKRHGRGGFKNYFNDDNAWWALAWIKAYDLYGDKKYLSIAEGIFDDMVNNGYDKLCAGGIVWNKNVRYKNAITNELFIVLGARLCQRQTDSARRNYYRSWAVQDYEWLKNSTMINDQRLINDGLDSNCNNNQATTWTYNQGVILGGLKELYLITSDSMYLHTALKIAYSAMQHLSDNNQILIEPCGDNCSMDGVQFKGIFIRYLSDLNTVLHDKKIQRFIQLNADSAWDKAQDRRHLFDYKWQGPYRRWSGAATGTALDLFNAACGIYY